MNGLAFDISHLLAGGLVLIGFMMLYQTRLYALLNVYAAQAFVLSLAVAWQAFMEGQPHLYVTASVAFLFKAALIPYALHRAIVRLGIDRDVENVVGVGITMLAGLACVALAIVVMLRIVANEGDAVAREDLAFALSVILLGMLMMVVRRNAISMVVGFMSLENGLILAAAGAKGMPLVVEFAVAFSVVVALVVIWVFLFRLQKTFGHVDAAALDEFQGLRR
jgi:hydrogenase-4 component E